MLDQIEQHFPGFNSQVETLIIGTPTTIERYLLKNWGAVGGPKNMIGQEMLKRLHARSEWKNLYVCGDSTVMATGAPATVVSGVGAANMVLQDVHRKDYDARKFPRQYIQFAEIPYTRPAFGAQDPINNETAWLAAAQCQGCENPACVRDCPASIDIPGIFRRMEAQNFVGAARELHQRSPFGNLCGTICPAESLCERRCYRRSFTGSPVRIAELLRWVNRSAGEAGWLKPDIKLENRRALVLGGTLAGMTCAYYLALSGYDVDVLDSPVRPLGGLLEAQQDLAMVLNTGIHYKGNQEPSQNQVDRLIEPYQAIFIASDEWAVLRNALPDDAKIFNISPDATETPPAHAIANGRGAAFEIYKYGEPFRRSCP
jgi:hypothetical protein